MPAKLNTANLYQFSMRHRGPGRSRLSGVDAKLPCGWLKSSALDFETFHLQTTNAQRGSSSHPKRMIARQEAWKQCLAELLPLQYLHAGQRLLMFEMCPL